MPDPRWTEETRALVAQALWAKSHPFRKVPKTLSAECLGDADAVLAALADAGLLLQPGGVPVRAELQPVLVAGGVDAADDGLG